MRIILIMIIGLMVSNCSNSSYVKNKKTITSPDDLQKFINVYCNKNKQTDKVIKVCGNGWSKDCLLYTSPSPRDQRGSRMPSSA